LSCHELGALIKRQSRPFPKSVVGSCSLFHLEVTRSTEGVVLLLKRLHCSGAHRSDDGAVWWKPERLNDADEARKSEELPIGINDKVVGCAL
jgi:hypothetical protein